MTQIEKKNCGTQMAHWVVHVWLYETLDVLGSDSLERLIRDGEIFQNNALHSSLSTGVI